jgi:two-component system, NtrC family, sensor kinase
MKKNIPKKMKVNKIEKLQEERYRMLMDNASFGLLVHDTKGALIEVNKQIENIFGHPRNEIIKNNFIFYIIPEERDNMEDQFKKLILEKKIGPHETRIKTSKDEIKVVELSAVSIGTELDNENLLLTIVNDITERKKLDEQTLLNHKLATIGTLSAGIAHEINNPIAWILSNLKHLKKKITNLKINDKENAQSFNDIIDETIMGTEKIQDIIKNLKGFARKDEEISTTPADVNEILSSAITMASHQIEDVAQLKTNLAEDLPKLLLCGSRLHQVFLNLIVNAIQAFPEKGNNNIITITTLKENNNIRIDIADTGPGISEEVLPHIFDLFFTTKPPGIGTGLGLSICNDIINRAGGRITVKSSPEQGTTFSVYLPLHDSAKRTTDKLQ